MSFRGSLRGDSMVPGGRHDGGSGGFADGLFGSRAAALGGGNPTCCPEPPPVVPCRRAGWHEPRRRGADRRHGSANAARLGAPLQRPRSRGAEGPLVERQPAALERRAAGRVRPSRRGRAGSGGRWRGALAPDRPATRRRPFDRLRAGSSASASATTSAPSASCSRGLASPTSVPAPSTQSRIRARSRRSGKLARSAEGAHCAYRAKQDDRGLVPEPAQSAAKGRDAAGAEERPGPAMGPQGVTAPPARRPALRERLPVRRRLPGPRRRCGPGDALCRHGSHAAPPRRDQPHGAAAGARRAAARPRGLAHHKRPRGAWQHQAWCCLTAAIARAEPS